jgi:hypothetical protein
MFGSNRFGPSSAASRPLRFTFSLLAAGSGA